MQIDKLCLDVYPRTSWQAIDLGCRMAVLWWWPLFRFTLCFTLPFFLIFSLLSLNWCIVLFWLFKPWYERGLIYILSRRVFGETLSLMDTIKAMPSQIYPLWFSSITWRRFSTSRAFDMPVTQLERLSGEARSQRLNTLHRAKDTNVTWWLIVCVHWEMIIVFAMYVLVLSLVPQGIDINVYDAMFTSEGNEVLIASNIAYYIAIIIVAPFYVSGCFSAYLNRRVHLEGWDIELSFKRMAKRFAKTTTSATHSLLLALGLSLGIGLMSGLAPTANVFASEQGTVEQLSAQIGENTQPTPSNTEFEQDKQAILNDVDAIVSNPPIVTIETVTRWEWVGWEFNFDFEMSAKENTDTHWLVTVVAFIAQFFEFILWGVFSIIIALFLWHARHNIAAIFTQQSPTTELNISTVPSFVKLEEDSEQLLSDIPGSIRTLLDKKAYRAVLSLLLLASLPVLAHAYSVTFRRSMTEHECISVIAQATPENIASLMKQLVNMWIKLAWAHISPSKESIEALCNNWLELFAEHCNVVSDGERRV